jgi:type I restriction enzyme R subunit
MSDDWKEYELVERPGLGYLEKLGWDIFDAKELDESELPDNRDSEKRVVLEDRLKSKIEELNPWISENNLNKAVRRITQVEATDTMDANEKIFENLVRGISLEQDRGKGKKNYTVEFVDWENPENNDFVAMNQFRVEGPGTPIKPDIVLFVNGIPLGVVECKNPKIENPMEEGLDQMARYQNNRGHEQDEGAEELFRFNQFSVVISKDEARMGTYNTPQGEFKPWKDAYPATDPELKEVFDTDKLNAQHTMFYSLFKPDRLLEMVQSFTVYETKRQNTIKMVARYQQYRATQKALERIEDRDRNRNGGVVWHTQGSGKSLTMLFLGLKLRKRKDNPTLLMVTDRQALEANIKNTFKRCGVGNPKSAESIEDLKQKLSENAGETLTTLIQKFQRDDDEEKFPLLSNDEDIYVMVDEAHRTQYDELANNMRTALPNAFYVGFTGTPIEKDKRNTKRTFGNYIDKYTIDQSIEDEVTVPILYQGRLADIHLEGRNLDDIFDRVFDDKTEEEKAEIKKRYAGKRDLAEAPRRIKMICHDILDHYDEKVANKFKGMIVTTSRDAAVKYKKQLDRLNGPESAVIISGDHNDREELKEYTPTDDEIDTYKERFEDPNDELQFLIVCDMLLTGYDAEIAQVMYLDKPLREHSLLQAIARVNRTYDNKTHGLVIDYYGVSDDLYKALDKFTREDIEKAMEPVEEKMPDLEAAHGKVMSFFSDVDIDNMEECMEVLENEKTRIEFNKAYKEFASYMDMVMPDPKANPYKSDLKMLGDIYTRAKNLYRDDSMNLSGAGEKVKEIIQENISSQGIEVINDEPVSVLNDEEFKKKLNAQRSDKAKAQEIEQGVKQALSVKMDEDPQYYGSLQEKVEEIIEEYKQQRIEEKEYIEKMKQVSREIRNRKKKAKSMGFSDTTQLSFYNTLDAKTSSVEDEDLQEAAIRVSEIFESNKVVDWKNKVNTRKKIKREINVLLHNLDLEQSKIKSITNELMKIGGEHY